MGQGRRWALRTGTVCLVPALLVWTWLSSSSDTTQAPLPPRDLPYQEQGAAEREDGSAVAPRDAGGSTPAQQEAQQLQQNSPDDIPVKDCPPPPAPAASTQQQQHRGAEECLANQFAWAVDNANAMQIFGDQFVPHLVDAVVGGFGKELCSSSGGHPAYHRPVVIDVGANLGQGIPTWIHLTNCSGASIVAYEPHPRTFHRLRENAEAILDARNVPSGRLALVQAAAGEAQASAFVYENFGASRGKLPKSMRAKQPAAAPFLKQLPWSEAGSTFTSLHQTHSYRTRKIGIRLVRVDHTVSAKIGCDRGILLLKTDAEGHDLQALQGAEGLLHRVELVIFEYNRLWRQVNNSLVTAAALLRRHGFATFLLGGKVLSLDTWPIDGAEKFNLYPEQQLTGLGIRRGGRTACLLRPFVLSRAVDDGCKMFLSDVLGCEDEELKRRKFHMASVARGDSWSNLRLQAARPRFGHHKRR